MTFHIYGRRKSRYLKILLDMEALQVGKCMMHPVAKSEVHKMQAVISYHFVRKTFKTHFWDGTLFILRIR